VREERTYQLVGWNEMKNCEPFVFTPELAIESVPGAEWRRVKFSSGNFPPKIDFPPVPSLFVKSPPWAICRIKFQLTLNVTMYLLVSMDITTACLLVYLK
jgi:hypothetical protein